MTDPARPMAVDLSFTRVGKQIMAGGYHYADAADEKAGEYIEAALIAHRVRLSSPDREGVEKALRAYFERGYICAGAQAVTRGADKVLSDDAINHAWEHRDDGLAEDDWLPTATALATHGGEAGAQAGEGARTLAEQIARDAAAFAVLPADEQAALNRELANVGFNPGVTFATPRANPTAADDGRAEKVRDLLAEMAMGDASEFETGDAILRLSASMRGGEVERLREALERIANGPWPDGIETPERQAQFDDAVARHALGLAPANSYAPFAALRADAATDEVEE